VDSFVNRLNHPASNVVKDMLYVIDQLNPPGKFKLFTAVLDHPNAILRLETLATIGRNPTAECFDHLVKVLRQHTDSAMRAQAARFLPNHEGDQAAKVLLDLVRNETFDKVPDTEKKAVFGAIMQLQTRATESFVKEVFEQKSGIFAKKRIDEFKMLLIEGMEVAPSIPGVQFLAEIAKDNKKHSKEVCEAARGVAISMKQKLLGA